MRRGIWLFAGMLAALFAFAGSSSAVPLLVELKIDALSSTVAPPSANEVQILPSGDAKGKGKGGGGGNVGSTTGSPIDLSKLNLKSLTLWLSTDGKSWKMLSGQITELTNDKISAQFKGSGSSSDPAALGLPAVDVTGQITPSYYIGVSTSSTSFSGTTLSAR